jgi:putative oxidoreductase
MVPLCWSTAICFRPYGCICWADPAQACSDSTWSRSRKTGLQSIVGLLFILAGVQHGTCPIDELAKQSRWATVLPLPLVRLIGLAGTLGGLGVLVALVVGQTWLAMLAASGLTLVMVLAVLFHLTRREYPEVGIRLCSLCCRHSSRTAGLSSSRGKHARGVEHARHAISLVTLE